MKIYVIERDNSDYRPEPEVLTDGKTAFETVRKEYDDQMMRLDAMADMHGEGIQNFWNFEEDDVIGDALIDASTFTGERFQWRITEHEIPTEQYGAAQ